jgi:hypothetical protein
VCDNTECARLLFPKIEPAVIMLVEAEGPPRRCLLARHKGSAVGGYSTLAGCVEVGESLDDAVPGNGRGRGVRVRSATYVASQAWPFQGRHHDRLPGRRGRRHRHGRRRGTGRGALDSFLLRSWLDEQVPSG